MFCIAVFGTALFAECLNKQDCQCGGTMSKEDMRKCYGASSVGAEEKQHKFNEAMMNEKFASAYGAGLGSALKIQYATLDASAAADICKIKVHEAEPVKSHRQQAFEACVKAATAN